MDNMKFDHNILWYYCHNDKSDNKNYLVQIVLIVQSSDCMTAIISPQIQTLFLKNVFRASVTCRSVIYDTKLQIVNAFNHIFRYISIY